MASSGSTNGSQATTTTTEQEGAAAPIVDGADGQVDEDAPIAVRRDRRASFERIASIVVPTWIVLRLLAADIGAIVTNDSILYLDRAHHPFGDGLIVQGYRQIGYPLHLWGVDRLAGFLDWDRLFTIALTQRALLLVALLAAWSVLRWWSTPLLLLATSPTFVVHSDLVLNEGLLIPLCALFAVGTAAAYRRADTVGRHPQLYLSALSALAVVMALQKLQFAAFLLLVVPVAHVFVTERRISWRRALIPMSAAIAAIGVLTIAQAFENRSELGVFEPVSEQARADWYGAYQVVFTLDPQNRADPALAEFYADGDLYEFLHGLEQTEPDYLVRREQIEDRVQRLFRAADTSSRNEQIRSFLGAFTGGRMDDIADIIDGALFEADRPRVTYNGKLEPDLDVIAARINEGRPPGALSIGPIAETVPAPIGDHRPWIKWVGPLSTVALALMLLVRGRHRVLAAAGLTLMSGVAFVLSSAYIDNARYLLGPITAVVVVTLTAASSIWADRTTVANPPPSIEESE